MLRGRDSMELSDREIATVLAALDAWKDELSEGMDWICKVHDFRKHLPLSKREVDQLRQRLKSRHQAGESGEAIQSWRLLVPTYLATTNSQQDGNSDAPDFGPPVMPVLIHEAEGIRLVLGTHNYQDWSKP